MMRVKHLVTLALCAAAAAHAGPIQQLPLDNFVVQRVPVATLTGNTTFLFPSPISALYTSRAALQEQPNADFLIDFQPGQYWFTLRALKKGVEDYITVIYERKAYVIRVTASAKPTFTVTFFRDGGSTSGQPRPITPARLLSLLDKAKAYKLFLDQEPDALAGVTYDRPARILYYPNFRILIEEVFRFEEDDTVVFHASLENGTDTPLYYNPADFAVQLNNLNYSASVADASGIMPPRSATAAYFGITGTPNGSRNNLQAKNNWNILLNVTDRVEELNKPGRKGTGAAGKEVR
ncbi:MAG TPA: hypothetical protein VIS99_12760 [Terrimicrobiaceae bacterium]